MAVKTDYWVSGVFQAMDSLDTAAVMKLRADRWRQNPAKDAERAAVLAPYVAAAERLESAAGKKDRGALSVPRSVGPAGEGTRAPIDVGKTETAAERFRWLVEEFRVSLFAQELGTAEPVSAVKLDRVLAESGAAPSPSVEPKRAVAKPAVVPRTFLPEKKSAPLKNLGALDKLFPR